MKLIRTTKPSLPLQTEGGPLALTRGGTAQAWRPEDQDDDRYFEEVTRPGGKIEWFELVNDDIED